MKSVIHEIKNHLAVAVANIEAFRDGVLEPSPARLGAVLQALAEADVLIGELPRDLVMEKPEPSVQTIDVCSVISNEVLALEAAAHNSGVAFHVTQCAHPEVECRAFGGDPVHIAEIVNNIISNAIRYTPRGGHIEVDCHRADGSLVLTVADSGPGITGSDRERIFESEFRGSAASGIAGSGVGLAVSKNFAEEHGGTIELLEATGSGATFVLKLPGISAVPAAHVAENGLISLL